MNERAASPHTLDRRQAHHGLRIEPLRRSALKASVCELLACLPASCWPAASRLLRVCWPGFRHV